MRQFGIERNGAECKDIRPHLKAIDPLFEVVFNFDTEEYMIYFNGGLLQTIVWTQMNQSAIERIRYVYWLNNNRNPFEEIDKANEKAEAAREKERDDMIGEMANDLHKAILREV